MFNYIIWKSRLDNADVRFLKTDDMPASGFRSVYLFSETDAHVMQATGSYKNFKGTVASTVLFIDADTEEASHSIEGRLQTMRVSYEKYDTGRRGNHYHVSRVPATGHMVPAYDRAFVSREFTGADLTFYHHVGMYRQPGAVHQKTGKRKVLLTKVEGGLIEVPATEERATAPRIDGRMQSIFLSRKLSALSVPHNQGERHAAYVQIAVELVRLGQPYDFACTYLANVNLLAEVPYDEKEMTKILRWAYEQSRAACGE